MGSVVGELLPLAVGVAVSPVAVIATILMLLSKRAGSTSAGFAVGWLLGIFIATVLFVILSSVVSTSDDGPSATVSWIKLALGCPPVGPSGSSSGGGAAASTKHRSGCKPSTR